MAAQVARAAALVIQTLLLVVPAQLIKVITAVIPLTRADAVVAAARALLVGQEQQLWQATAATA
jgi:hypothetical protein